MKPLLYVLLSLLFVSLFPAFFTALPAAPPQSRERRVTTKTLDGDETVRVDVDLVVFDALVMQRKTGRIIGNLKKEDFMLEEDGVRQEITHFGQNTLPLSVVLLVDRGGCLDPFGENVRRATVDALSRLKPTDEVALMSYHNTTKLEQGFTRSRLEIEQAIYAVSGHDEEAAHCLNRAFYDAADYMLKAGNPAGRRVIIVITAVTSNFDCEGPSGTEATHAVFESGSVVCGIIPKSAGQRIENGVTRAATGFGKLFNVRSMSVNKLAEETGGEVMHDKPEQLDRAFATLIEHLRTRYQMGFVPTNRKRDGTTRKLKVKINPSVEKAEGKLAIKTRSSYIAPKDGMGQTKK